MISCFKSSEDLYHIMIILHPITLSVVVYCLVRLSVVWTCIVNYHAVFLMFQYVLLCRPIVYLAVYFIICAFLLSFCISVIIIMWLLIQ